VSPTTLLAAPMLSPSNVGPLRLDESEIGRSSILAGGVRASGGHFVGECSGVVNPSSGFPDDFRQRKCWMIGEAKAWLNKNPVKCVKGHHGIMKSRRTGWAVG